MLKIQRGEHFVFAGSAGAGAVGSRGNGGAEAMLEAAASYMEERGGALALAAYKDEIKYELVKCMRGALREQMQREGAEPLPPAGGFLAALFLLEEDKVIHIRLGKRALLGLTEEGHIGNISMSRERAERSILMDGAIWHTQMGVSVLTEYRSFYMLEEGTHLFALCGGREGKTIALDGFRTLICYSE